MATKKKAAKKKATKKKAKKKAKKKRPTAVKAPDVADVDAYIAAAPASARAALTRIRKIIRAAAPDATEVISYRVPTFKLHGGLVGFAAFPAHCSFFVMSLAVMSDLASDVAPYAGGKATLHFTQAKPLPEALVRKIVRARIAENAARARGSRP